MILFIPLFLGLHLACERCPDGFTTSNAGATNFGDCSLKEITSIDPCNLNSCGSGANCVPGGPDGFICECPPGSLLLHTFDDGRIICSQRSDLISLLEKSGSKQENLFIPDEPSRGFKDCGKRSGQRDVSLSFSNGASVSAQEVNYLACFEILWGFFDNLFFVILFICP